MVLRGFQSLGCCLTMALMLICACSARAKEDDRPVVDDSKQAKETAAKAALPTFWIVGDSTVKSDAPKRGWGQDIGDYFDKKKINVVNRAIGGRSSRTFQNEGRWDAVVKELKAGDFVIVQFGHNDAGAYDDPKAKGRPSLKGEGEETADVTKKDAQGNDVKETVHTFGWYMRKYCTDTKAKGATVILCSMVPHKDWKDGHIQRGEQNSLVKWTKNAAEKNGCLYIDLNDLVALQYEKLGEQTVAGYFDDARTHTNATGSKVTAEVLAKALKELSGNPLGQYMITPPATQP